MPRPILATVSLAALRHNLALLQHRLQPGAELMAVVKANAYGHGIDRVFPALSTAQSLALLDLTEAQLCRRLGWTKPILLLEGAFEPGDYDDIAGLSLDFTVHTDWQLQALRAFLDAGGRLPGSRVFVKVNTGMNRLGLMPAEAQAALLQALAWVGQGSLGAAILMTHFANADERQPVGPTAADQAAVFTALRHSARLQADARGLSDVPFSTALANSAAALVYPDLGGQLARIGIAAYGSSSGPISAEAAGLRPVMCLSSRIIGVQQLRAGDRVGYGSRFAAPGPMRIGVVACGYADGYPRHAPDGAPVVVCGQRTRLVGRVSMDMLTVDLTHLPQADVGAPVTLFGGASLSVDELASECGTIGYELLCAVAPRVPFVVDAQD